MQSNSISIIIIGFNTKKYLNNLLQSIKQIKNDASYKINEVIYIDDGSSDNSLFLFKDFDLGFEKKYFGFEKNMGRVFATKKGVEIATGDWLLLLQSNMLVDSNLVLEYWKAIKNRSVVAVGGKIIYYSKDRAFEKYLNNQSRGINQYKQYSTIKYQNLLFGNCLIQKKIFKKIKLNTDLKYYGGEELDFSYRLSQEYNQKIIACTSSIVYRVDHPTLLKHIARLEEFGKYNFLLLNSDLKTTIVKNKFFILDNALIKVVILAVKIFLTYLYRMGIRNSMIIKLLLLLSLLKGYHQRAR